MRLIVLALGLAVAMTGSALAQLQPPIKSPEDATCREDARNRLLGAPNPKGCRHSISARNSIMSACDDSVRKVPTRSRASDPFPIGNG